MDIFVRNLPPEATKKQIENFFREPLAECGITHCYAEKFLGKGLATLTVIDVTSGQRFLALYGELPNIRAVKRLFWNGNRVYCSESNKKPTDFSVRSLAFDASQRAASSPSITSAQANGQNKRITRFAIKGLHCGVWDYTAGQLCFTTHFMDSRPGAVTFGLREAIILLGGSGTDQCRCDFSYHDCDAIALGSYADPSISFTLRIAPNFYRVSGEDVLGPALLAMTLGPEAAKSKAIKKTRMTGINEAHSELISGTCFCYRIVLSDFAALSTVRSLLRKNYRMPSTLLVDTAIVYPTGNLDRSFARLHFDLADTGRYGRLPFTLLYQLYRLARNGILPPLRVRELLPKIAHMHTQFGLDAVLSAVRQFARQLPLSGPGTDYKELSNTALEQTLQDLEDAYDNHQNNLENPYELAKRHTHINLIHKAIVTPTSVRLEGPFPEPTNRVLRRYEINNHNFMRMEFRDEDGGSVRYDPRSSQEDIFNRRFKGVLDGNILIAGRAFSFLGFSHSSLRDAQCWFMAPIFSGGNFVLPENVMKSLGNFESIRVPAKCAARIGQNFTDTNATVDLQPDHVFEKDIVTRNGRDFSDGVGTISEQLLHRLWKVYGTRRQIKPTALQIRFQGCKEMVSLDSRLRGEQLVLRSNMKKYEAYNSWNLEICGAAFKNLPMILNRQFIKLLEDLGIDRAVFMDLQKKETDRLRLMTGSAINTATFLEESECTKATRMPSLIHLLGQIGLDYHHDPFLYRVVEAAVVMKLRDVKYRGRIPVEAGYPLYGIMDEFGILRENEIYVVTEKSPQGGRSVLVQDNVLVTRSPAIHPGDIQRANAVDVPSSCPLKNLSNVVVFSQFGERDLPSQLSGGDLDGDLYNVIFDERLIPSTTFPAADYPKVSAVELDRPVTRKDMSDFFVKFMESDQLGMLSNLHLQLADQRENGTFDSDCIKLASMASVAVDYSKTGIVVNMKECPRHDRCRPDFMAPSPRVIVTDNGKMDFEDIEEDDETFEGMDIERRGHRYYESNKVLGELYRAIDERQFLSKMQQDRLSVIAGSSTSTSDILRKLLGYLKHQASVYGVLFPHHRELAADIRAAYEEGLVNVLYAYSPVSHQSLSEHEAFAGTILGRRGGAQGKPLRELSKTMRERFEAVVEYTVMRIVKGDEQMRGVTDLDLLYADVGADLDRELEALPRAIACLAVTIEEHGTTDRQLGRLQSFQYISAAVALSELKRYRISMGASSLLPSV